MKTAVVILNWNTERYLQAFLPALVASCGRDDCVVVADNGSSDGSIRFVQEAFPGVRTIALGANYGFTGGYNRALAQVEAEYFVLINSDVDVSPGWLEPLIDYMDANPGCAACGPKLHVLGQEQDGSFSRTSRFEYAGAAGGLVDRYGYPFCRGRVLQLTDTDRGQYDAGPGSVLWVSGACLVTRSSVWNELGGLDERFFAHMEEIDYCWRAQLAGYSVAVVPESTVWHLGGGTLATDSPFKLELNHRNNLLLLENNLPRTIGAAAARARILFRMLLDWGSALVYLLSGKPRSFRAVVRAHKGFHQLRRPGKTAEGRRQVHGYWEKCIILQSLLRGKGIFRYLMRYEDSH